ncbi:5'-methylthioadenosine/S-adenosylhomocysteine nucleosidase family protein [Aspergillus saccharolyticus JOP 1030-1]|uniref:Purine and uridine phosphorylase n=1 Tax=Aspergillus saccharolyticus JOP 1030-1 TaxID=1450539 RepID=A0A318Z636_9EURO|nr:purine and uridine phosphorylase [Aspergillus saccharolyticus JOP 1030-1]PYH42576.1 purine and uridine phosphorylase [Aspergillus saccharolyticus JOP 1030-1]
MSRSEASIAATHEATISQINYLIGWICILPSEYYEASKMFDEVFDSSGIIRGRNDRNSYDIGHIGGHLVVMNCPAAGNNGEVHAARIASDMRSTFPSIRFMLLVGIGGGSPSRQDVRLGDVVLGTKVVPYRHGKNTDHGFEVIGKTGTPPPILQSAMTRLGLKLRQDLNIEATIQEVRPYTVPRPATDNLYLPTYIHSSCCDCLRAEAQALGSLSVRNPRRGNLVQVHQGVVGSADQVMKKASERDEYAGKQGIICYEMEAVGIMETISCLTIRGISDYSDGHKNDDWHSYASLSAAVCAKELLKNIPAQDLERCPLEVSQYEIERWARGAIEHFYSSQKRLAPEPETEFQTAVRNLDTIFDVIGLIQLRIDPWLNDLSERPDPVAEQEMRDSVEALRALQGELSKCMKELRSQAKQEAKRPDNSEAKREEWRSLKRKIKRQTRWSNEVSKATRNALWSTKSATLRVFLLLGQSGNQAVQATGESLHQVSQQALRQLKHLLEEFKHRLYGNPQDAEDTTSTEGRTSGEDTASQADAPALSSEAVSPRSSQVTSISSDRGHPDDTESHHQGRRSPSPSLRHEHISEKGPPPPPPTRPPLPPSSRGVTNLLQSRRPSLHPSAKFAISQEIPLPTDAASVRPGKSSKYPNGLFLQDSLAPPLTQTKGAPRPSRPVPASESPQAETPGSIERPVQPEQGVDNTSFRGVKDTISIFQKHEHNMGVRSRSPVGGGSVSRAID